MLCTLTRTLPCPMDTSSSTSASTWQETFTLYSQTTTISTIVSPLITEQHGLLHRRSTRAHPLPPSCLGVLLVGRASLTLSGMEPPTTTAGKRPTTTPQTLHGTSISHKTSNPQPPGACSL